MRPSRATLVREIGRLFRFVIVGVANTAIYTVAFVVLMAVSVTYVVAAVLASAISIAIAYWLNHRFTFRADAHTRQLVAQFFLVQGLGAIVNVVALAVVVERAHWDPLIAQLVVLPPVVSMTFAANRLVVFRAHVDARGVGG